MGGGGEILFGGHLERGDPVPQEEDQRHARHQQEADAELGIVQQPRPRRGERIRREGEPRQGEEEEEEDDQLSGKARLAAGGAAHG